jgi:hypothetical protein
MYGHLLELRQLTNLSMLKINVSVMGRVYGKIHRWSAL